MDGAETLGFPEVSWHLTRTPQGVSTRSRHCGSQDAHCACLARHCCVCVRAARGRHGARMRVDAVSVRSDSPAIDLTGILEFQKSDTDRIQVSTAPGTDGIVRRIEVRAREGGTNWVVFALANNTDDQLDRLIVAPHYRIVSSGLLWPDLGLSRIATITPSTGDRPERQDNPITDIFRVTLDPGSVVTFVVELRTDKLPQLYLWEPEAYKDKVNSFTLYQGIVIGIAGLLSLVLTILFVVKGSIMFPAAAGLVVGGAGLYRHRLRLLGQGARHVVRRRARLARVGRSDPRRDAAGVPVRLSQSQPLARALLAHHRRLARLPRLAGGAGAVRSAGGLRHRPHLAGADRGVRLRADRLPLHPRLRPRGAADPELVPAAGLGDRRRHDHPGQRHQRHRRPCAARRPGADRHADRLHGDAACLCGRRLRARHRHRRRAARAGADRRGRPDLGLGRLRRQGVHQRRDRKHAGPAPRHAGRSRRQVARGAASAGSGPLPRGARQRARPAPRPPGAGFPPAHAGRPLHVVLAEGAPGGRLRRRSRARDRHARPTSPSSRTPKSGCCTIRCTTT